MPQLRLHNTLTRSVDPFAPANPDGVVRYYACGPTVYHDAHIGNLRTYVFMDILRRVLLFFGHRVRLVMNITDVGHMTTDADEGEDKMAVAARREHRSPQEIAEHYTKAFLQDLDRLHIHRPGELCKATENIPDMIALIERLLAKGLAYRRPSGVYFDTAAFPNYGKLARLKLDAQEAGARIEIHPDKKNPYDFALWKLAQPTHIMQWDSPWGRGYPGWHIECSAMAMKHLGETIDIHSGGIDHIPVHHENEIAQSEGATGKPFARFWMHAGFLEMGAAAKMSKSSGEFLTLSTLVERGFHPLAYRFFCFTAKYRMPLAFSEAALRASQKTLQSLWNDVRFLPQEALTGEEPFCHDYEARFSEAIADDLNLPKAVAELHGLVAEAHRRKAYRIYTTLLKFDRVLGLGLETARTLNQDLPERVRDLMREREDARCAKDFPRSDILREEIKKAGYVLEDTPEGVRWKPA